MTKKTGKRTAIPESTDTKQVEQAEPSTNRKDAGFTPGEVQQVTNTGAAVSAIVESDPMTSEQPAAPIPPLVQAANTRKALDDSVKADIIVMLSQPGANMTKIANDLGVSYGTVQSIKSKLAKPTPVARAPRAVTPKAVAQTVIDDVELMKLELEFLRKKVAYLESRASK